MISTANAFLLSSPFKSSPLSHIPSSTLTSRPAAHLFPLLLAYHRLLLADPALPTRHTWPNEPLHNLASQHTDIGVRLLAVQVLSRQMGWSEVKRIQLEKAHVGDMDKVDAPMLMDGEVVDGWLFGILETKRIQQRTFSQMPRPCSLRKLISSA